MPLFLSSSSYQQSHTIVREQLLIVAHPTWDHFFSYATILDSGFWLPKLASIYIVTFLPLGC